mmetsp:Transcript_12663/g.14989  ORF Transcript_12663/g.14989 Transcript_12663/m.14989 type:complete len:103 (-) Transcript_12663:193-501(-)|eukprot:jgi/Bigna1/48203/estExt_Genewise1.C_230191
MSSPARSLNPTPPLKGSFPLDHFGECKRFRVAYLKCLKAKDGAHIECLDKSKSYLQCRMDAGLMEKEEMSKLGFSKRPRKNVSSTAYQKSKESKGFIAGLNK